MWNNNNYEKPSGYKSSGGFSKDYGYGHEEWNNNPNWIWRNYRVFHTEFQPKLLDYSNSGDLCILMIASYNKKQFAVGIATNVFHNDEEEMKLISKELNIFDNHKEIWKQETVKKCFQNNNSNFLEHWKKHYKWIRWKCPTQNYLWFAKPILLNATEITGKEKFISMHGSYQAVLPQTILQLIHNEIKDNSDILDWLTSGEFDTDWVKDKSQIKTNENLRKKYFKNRKNATTKKSFTYWIEGQRNIEPLHAKLQSKLTNHLSELGIKFKENENFIDVQYFEGNKTTFCEIKPTENIDTKYAIRIAIGQLLEYKFLNNNSAELEIVLSSKPLDKEIEFVKSLKMKITYFDNEQNKFITK